MPPLSGVRPLRAQFGNNFGGAPRRRRLGQIEAVIEQALLDRFIVGLVRLHCPLEAQVEHSGVIDDRPGPPMGIVGIMRMIDTMAVQEQTGTRYSKKLINLAADIAKIDIRHVGVGHIRRRTATKIDMDVWRPQVFAIDPARPVDTQTVDGHDNTPFEQHDMRREYQGVVGIFEKEVQDRASMPVP